MSVASQSQTRLEFFELVFQDYEGWICIATSDPKAPRTRFAQRFFKWPSDANKMETFIVGAERNKNVYFCINILNKAERRKENCLPSNVIWADLDQAKWNEINPIPSIVIESSPDRYQAIWRTTTTIEPALAEVYSKRVAYEFGADKSGWDLGQLLRVPLTRNFKYEDKPQIQILHSLETPVPVIVFEAIKPLEEAEWENPVEVELARPIPEELPDPDMIIYKYRAQLKNTAFASLFLHEPGEEVDWSQQLWRLIHICFESGMDEDEAFVIAKASPLNKYERDLRPVAHLWRDVLKAKENQVRLTIVTQNFKPLGMPHIVDHEPPTGYDDTFIYKYRQFAEEATDAIANFHDLSAFVMLSVLISNTVRLEANYGTVVPNIWGLILGDSTLSRKTTAMRMVVEIIGMMDRETIIATDGSVEGLLGSLENRSNMSSLFFRDEVSGFFEQINRREYLAGMMENMAQLYDVPPYMIRKLRKESIRIESPIFIFLGGGVRDRVYQAINDDYILSGFLPRFLVVSGDTDLSRIRKTGPAQNNNIAKKAEIISHVADLKEQYSTEITQTIGGEKISILPRIIAELSRDAWEFYGNIENQMLNEAYNSFSSGLALPTFERMSRSLLKMSVILAASRQIPIRNTIKVNKKDVHIAAWYVQEWGPHMIDLVMNASSRSNEKILDRVLKAVRENPGILRGTIMQHLHLYKREADEVFQTLEERGMIRSERAGKGFRYFQQ